MKAYEDENLKVLFQDKAITYDDYMFVLNHLDDEKSKILFYYRTMIDLTSNPYYTLMLDYEMFKGEKLDNVQTNLKNFVEFLLKDNNYQRNIIIIGNDPQVLNVLYGLTGKFNNALKIKMVYEFTGRQYYTEPIHGKILKHLPIDSMKLEPSDDNIYIIGDEDYYYVYNFLIEKGFSKDRVYLTNTRFQTVMFHQYFGESFLKHVKDEVFVDGGAFYLETTFDFKNWSNNKYKKIYAFEPNEEIYNSCLNIIKEDNIENIEMYNYGLWNSKGKINFIPDNGGSRISDDGSSTIQVNSIDNVLKGKEATFIKLDIEGSEFKALMGAQKTIKKYKPKLAISIYHKYLDCIILTKYILELNSDYKIRIRHYNLDRLETVLYAF